MKIIILGAGRVGSTVAETLVGEDNDVTIVDNNLVKLNALKDRLDIRTVHGHAAYPSVLEQAGAEDADMLIAVANRDETNMIACQVAYTLFHTPQKICRVRNPEFTAKGRLFNRKAIPIDETISPHQEITHHISRLIKYPGSLQVLDFANGKAQLVAVRAYHGGPLIGHELKDLANHIPSVDTRVAAIYRQNHAIIPDGDTRVEADDEVFFIAAKRNIRAVMSEMRRIDKDYKRIMIAGGGNIGAQLASDLEDTFQVKVIEQNKERCIALSEKLHNSIVLHGVASNQDLLLEENVDATDVFCALTNDDETNIMASMLAKKLGAGKVITLINNVAYVDLVQGGQIDIAISPQQITVSRLLRHVRQGDIANVYSLRRGAAEALEIVARGDAETSQVVGKRLDEIPLPENTIIGALVRDKEVLIAHRDVVIESEDHVILFLQDKTKVEEVERLFQVGFSFF